MDLLKQYKQQNPEAFREQKPAQMADEYGREYSTFVALVMRLSGGRIKDARQANYALLAVVIVFMLLALLFFTGLPGSSAPTHPNIINP